ncbi:MAG: Dabb family protein [Clostridia bacterium]|nr:Dabb family protein [Clostridia bacterium]
MIKHIVCHKYTDRAQAAVIAPMLRGLVGQVPGLVSMEAGADFLGSARSYDLALIATLESRAALEVYANHPAHVKVKEYIHQHLQNGISVDFEVE